MDLFKQVLSTLPTDPIPVRKLIVGVHWTLVASRYCGLASTMVGAGPHGHSPVRDVGNLHNKSAQELAKWTLSDNQLEASIGLAALNSLLELKEDWLVEVNAAEVISQKSKGRNLAVVGHFPFIDRIKDQMQHCWVIEQNPYGDDIPEEKAADYIPKADVVVITATTLINKTFDGLLALCHPQAQVMLLGPSTPLTPLLFDHGISFLSGARVVDEEAAILTIQQGAGFPQVKGTRLLTITRALMS